MKKKETTRKNRCIVCNIRPSKDEVERFKTDTLKIDSFWDDLLNEKEWKRKKRS